MPKVLVVGEFSVLIFLNDHAPAHVHVRKAKRLAKIALQPEVILLRYDKDFAIADLRKMITIVKDNQDFLLLKWNEFHPDDDKEDDSNE